MTTPSILWTSTIPNTVIIATKSLEVPISAAGVVRFHMMLQREKTHMSENLLSSPLYHHYHKTKLDVPSSGGGSNEKFIAQRSYMTTGRYTELLRYLLYTVMATRSNKLNHQQQWLLKQHYGDVAAREDTYIRKPFVMPFVSSLPQDKAKCTIIGGWVKREIYCTGTVYDNPLDTLNFYDT